MEIGVVDVLTKAREIIESKESWTQKAFARDKYGDEVYPQSILAVCFCAVGAIERVLYSKGIKSDFKAKSVENVIVMALNEAIAGCEDFECARDIISVNDYVGHEDVLYFYDRAIARIKQGPTGNQIIVI